MKKNRLISIFINAIMDPERAFVERVYLALAMVSELTVFIALIGDLLTKENPLEIAVIIGILIFVPMLTIFCLRRNKIMIAIKITVVALAFAVLPLLYLFGGGIEGGGVLWIIFTFTYAGLVLTGTWRAVMFVIIFLMSLSCYFLEYFHPELIFEHSRKTFFIDSFLSIVLVGIICFVMTWVQNWLFMGENKRAKEAAERAEELSRAQNRFFSSMSHEIRTPINSILGLNELILRDQSASNEILRDASGIQGSGKMLLALINDILDFSKMEAGSMDIVPVDYRIGDLLSEIVGMVWIKAEEKGLRFNVSIDPKMPTVLYGDEVRVKQIIINLLNNAIKYTNEGTVELHVERDDKDLKTVKLAISVTDTGIGIKKETIPYLFDAFKRVDVEKNRRIEGTGLGLSIVKQLVELMGGSITVNSVYGEGTTFTVLLNQGVSDHSPIGNLNIHSQSFDERSAYESSFRAPDVRILIVDDNEMNLEVESKLLTETEMTIDKALSGKEALELDLLHHYDVILMDHLMPEMDGIECLEKIRNHTGGLNRTTPVVVLTANAGSDNKELYHRAGFDGYLMKPVSGEALENALMAYIAREKMVLNTNKAMTMKQDISASAGYTGKVPIIITCTSMCDLPDSLIKKLHIPILPFIILTEEGRFKDGVQMGADELTRYISLGKNATSSPPDETAYTDFFATQLKRAHHLIHIALTTSMSDDFKAASEAAKSFDNVTVINSEAISSSTGILVLIAIKLAQMNSSVEDIVAELEMVRHRLKCSFIIDTTEYMAKKGLVSPGVDRFVRSMSLHPSFRIQDDRSGIGGIWLGNRKRAYKKYIAKAFPVDVIPDPEVVFITHAAVPIDTLNWIKDEISKIAYFENVVFQQASAAICANCGPGAFGILYFVKFNKSYNLYTFFEDTSVVDSESGDDEDSPDVGVIPKMQAENNSEDEDYRKPDEDALSEEEKEPEKEPKWYDSISGIDGEVALKNSGSEDAFRTVLEIFYKSIDNKAEELDKYYSEEDYQNYTIKIHALKSSCKLIGAVETSDKAFALEMAGKEGNTDYIRENHSAFIGEYLSYKKALDPIFKEEEQPEESDRRPVADEFLMDCVYEGLHDAAEAMDCDAIEEVFDEVAGYAIPENEAEKFNALKEKAGSFDYEGMLEILNS
jgi:DegV family protein with EDD domain